MLGALVQLGSAACGGDPPVIPPQTCDPISDRNALIALYNSTNGANWINTWNLNQPMSMWYGVLLNEEGCVIRIDFDGVADWGWSGFASGGNNLSGTIPPELGNLNNLSSLLLGYNQLTGSIPYQLGDLAKLHALSLHSNDLTGSIPHQLLSLIHI